MIVFHGTGSYAVEFIRAKGLNVQRRNYVKRPCACTTSDIAVAQRFAARKTLAADFLAGKITGVVLEFKLYGTNTIDFASVRDHSTHQEESEIAVFDTRNLRLVAIHRCRDEDGEWVREAIR